MTAPTTQAPTLIVGDRKSRCSACGRLARPGRTTHTTDPYGVAGCGAAYTAVTVEYGVTASIANVAANVARQLGLPYLGRWPDDPQRGSAGRLNGLYIIASTIAGLFLIGACFGWW